MRRGILSPGPFASDGQNLSGTTRGSTGHPTGNVSTFGMRVLVIGGSGFIGREIVRGLVHAGHAVRVLSRHSSLPEVETVKGDVRDGKALRSASMDCEAILYLAGIIAEVGPQTYERVHHQGVLHALAAAHAVGVRRWIQMSALGTRESARARYHQTKWAAEEAVRASGLDWTIFRPSVVFGPGDGFIRFFERMSRWSPVLPLIGGGGMLFQPVAVGDVARCFVEGLTSPAAIGRTYDVCGRERWTLRSMLEEILQVTGRRRLLLNVPWGLAQVQALCMETVFADILRLAPPLNRDQLLMLGEDNVGDPEPAFRDFRIKPLDFATGIRRYLPRSGS